MDREIIAPKTDIMFKSIFTNYENCLKDLLASILKIPVNNINSIEFLSTEFNPENMGNKSSRLDLAVLLDGKIMNVEMQLNKTQDFVERSLYYWSFLYCRGSQKGQAYNVIPDTIAINILDYKLFDDNHIKHTAQITYRETRQIMTDKFSILYYELPKVSANIEPENRLQL